MKLAIIYSKKKLSGKLTNFFTGCYAYHVGWVDEEHDRFYDMNLLRRRQIWSVYSEGKTFTLHDIQGVTREYLETQLETDGSRYGVLDYTLFAIRPLYHIFGLSTRNAGGVICSEMVNIDMWANGIVTPFKLDDGPPSPCDLARWKKDNIC